MAFGTATVVTNSGRAIVTNRIIGSGTEPKFIAFGTGAQTAARTAAVTDTALSTELSEGRATGTGTRVTTAVTNDTYQTVGTVTMTGTRAVDEAGTFDAITTGNMMVSATFPAVNLLSGDSLQATVKVQFA